jgi:hypothetical protein
MTRRIPRTLLRAATAVLVALLLSGVAASAAGAAGAPTRVKGRPTSTNGASSFHVTPVDAVAAAQEVSVVLEIRQLPAVSDTYFWALQVDFVDQAGRTVSGAHLGLQWNRRHRGNTAVNFGGYRQDASGHAVELSGTSKLAGANGSRNTFDYSWHPGAKYLLRIVHAGDGWDGQVTDLSTGKVTIVRHLRAGGVALAHPIVWSEVFASCEAPATAVAWSSLQPAVTRFAPSYQSFEQGGCTNTSTDTIAGAIVQRTNVRRTSAPGALLFTRV